MVAIIVAGFALSTQRTKTNTPNQNIKTNVCALGLGRADPPVMVPPTPSHPVPGPRSGARGAGTLFLDPGELVPGFQHIEPSLVLVVRGHAGQASEQ